MNAKSDENPVPDGELALQLPVLPRDTNSYGDISCGWLVSQMDTAATIAAGKVAAGRVITVAADNMSFLIPIQVGDLVSLYTKIVKVGRSSIQVFVEVWIENEEGKLKVTEGLFVLVALDTQGRTRSISN